MTIVIISSQEDVIKKASNLHSFILVIFIDKFASNNLFDIRIY